MDRNKLLEKKNEEIREDLEFWATRYRILSPGEELVFTLGIRQIPTVVSEPIENNFLNMSLRDFLSEERIEEGGFPAKFNYFRIHNVLGNLARNPDYKPSWMKDVDWPNTVGDLVNLPKPILTKFFGKGWIRGIGGKKSKTKKIIRAVLEKNGIKL